MNKHTSEARTTCPHNKAAAWAWRVGLWTLVVWLLTGFASLVLLYVQAPVTDQDLALVNWADGSDGRYRGLMWISVAVMLAGSCIGVAAGTPMPALYGVVFAAVLHYGWNPTSVTQLGILEGEARLGCFKGPSVECPAKFSLDSQVSAKDSTNSGGAVVPEATFRKNSFFRTASLGVLVAPLHWNHGPQLADLLKKQHETVAQQRIALQGISLKAVSK